MKSFLVSPSLKGNTFKNTRSDIVFTNHYNSLYDYLNNPRTLQLKVSKQVEAKINRKNVSLTNHYRQKACKETTETHGDLLGQ